MATQCLSPPSDTVYRNCSCLFFAALVTQEEMRVYLFCPVSWERSFWVIFWVMFWVVFWVIFFVMLWVVFWVIFWVVFCVIFWVIFWVVFWVIFHQCSSFCFRAHGAVNSKKKRINCLVLYLKEEQFLGFFAKLRKATFSFVMSACLYVRPQGATRLQLDGFSLI